MSQGGAFCRVEIGFVLTASYEFLPAVTRGFRQSNPDIHLELHEMTSAEQIAALLDHQIDVAFLRPPLAEIEGLAMERIYSERLVAILSDDHPLAAAERIDLEMLDMPPIRHGADELVHDLPNPTGPRLPAGRSRTRDYQ